MGDWAAQYDITADCRTTLPIFIAGKQRSTAYREGESHRVDSKYCTIVTTSTEIAKWFCVSNKDETFVSLNMLDKALRKSRLLSPVDSSRKKPVKTEFNKTGYTAEAIVDTIDTDEMPSYTVIAEDDCYKYYAESIIVFTCIVVMINKDMYHMFIKPIWMEAPVKIYKTIQKHSKGGKNHHVEAARKKLNAHRLGSDIERDLFRLLELISDQKVAQKMELPEAQKFGILRIFMTYEERVLWANPTSNLLAIVVEVSL